MTNPKLPRDYLLRSRKRLKAVALLLDEEAFADVVRESQEVVELLLKAALRSFGLAVPFNHDVSETLEEHAARLPPEAQERLETLGHPLLAIVEAGLRDEGILETGYDWYVKWIDLSPGSLDAPEFLTSFAEWKRNVEKYALDQNPEEM